MRSHELFRFYAVQSARPLTELEEWRTVGLQSPYDIGMRRNSGSEVHDAARGVVAVDAWLQAAGDRRSGEEVVVKVAQYVSGTEKNPPVSPVVGFVTSESYSQHRLQLGARILPHGRDQIVRALLVCGLLERLADRERAHDLDGSEAVAGWLASAVVVDDRHNTASEASGGAAVQRFSGGQGISLLDRVRDVARSVRGPLRVNLPVPMTSSVFGGSSRSWLPKYALARPPAFGELITVEQTLCGYETGELADVRNVLRGEIRKQVERRLDVEEREEVTETQASMDRAESVERRQETLMRAEVEETIQQDDRFDMSVNVDAKYPPYVQVTTNTDVNHSTSTSQAQRTVSELAEQVTQTAAKRVAVRELSRLVTRIRREREHRFRHSFDGKNLERNETGVYLFIDAVWQGQALSHGERRLLCEFIVPEPAAWLREALRRRPPDPPPDVGPAPVAPVNSQGEQLSPQDLTPETWEALVAKHEVPGVSPPPEPTKVLSTAVTSQTDSDTPPRWVSFDSDLTISVPEGYVARSYTAHFLSWGRTDAAPRKHSIALTVGDAAQEHVALDSPGIHAWADKPLGSIEGTVPVTVMTDLARGYTGTVTVMCELTDLGLQRWQAATYTRIMAAYQAKLDAYEAKLQAHRQGREDGYPASIRSNDARRTIETELRKLCLYMLAGGNFPRPDNTSPLSRRDSWPEPNLLVNARERERILFLEHAFEWSLLQYVPYPYYWADKAAWSALVDESSTDAFLTEFERAGAARVMVAARHPFELAVLRYLATGELWAGGRVPQVNDPLYVSLALEIQEQRGSGAKGSRVGPAFQYSLATPHIILGDLPRCSAEHDDDADE